MRISLDFCRGALRIDERGAAALLCLGRDVQVSDILETLASIVLKIVDDHFA